MGKTVTGQCRICGQNTVLTFEHVPPKATCINKSVKFVNFMDMIKAEAEDGVKPWELERVSYSISQRGRGDYYLCANCNNTTGGWYGDHYKRFIEAFSSVLYEIRNDNCTGVHIQLKSMRPLAIFKQIITMFCDINPGFSEGNPWIRDFLLDKESRVFKTDKYRLFMYMLKSGIERTSGFSALVTIGSNQPIVLSEIASVPVGFVLYSDLPHERIPPLTEINSFLECEYEDTADISLLLPICENNSIFPGDFRTKSEILNDIAKNNGAKGGESE